MRFLYFFLLYLFTTAFAERLPSLCTGEISHPISISNFTYNRGFAGGSLPHKGIDISVPVGTEILAIRTGVVETVRWDRGLTSSRDDGGVGYGYYIIIRYHDGYTGYYAHLIPDSERRYPGEEIVVGEVIAESGNSGRSTGPHLHYGEKNELGEWVDPAPIIAEGHYLTHPHIKLDTNLARAHRFEKRRQNNCQREEEIKIKIANQDLKSTKSTVNKSVNLETGNKNRLNETFKKKQNSNPLWRAEGDEWSD